jgi:hypothetical protein
MKPLVSESINSDGKINTKPMTKDDRYDRINEHSTPYKNHTLQKPNKNLIGTAELGEKYCAFIVKKSVQFFNDAGLANNLKIEKSKDAIKEIFILNIFSLYKNIFNSRLENNIKTSIVDYTINSYLNYIIQNPRVNLLNERAVEGEIDNISKLIKVRFSQYEEIFKIIDSLFLNNDVPETNEVIKIGNELFNILKYITSQKADTDDIFFSLNYVEYFMDSLRDEKILEIIKSDIDHYQIKEGYVDSLGDVIPNKVEANNMNCNPNTTVAPHIRLTEGATFLARCFV